MDDERDITHTLQRLFLHMDKLKGEMEMERVAREVTAVSLLATGGTLVNGDTSNVTGTKDNAPPGVVSNNANCEGSDKDRYITHTRLSFS